MENIIRSRIKKTDDYFKKEVAGQNKKIQDLELRGPMAESKVVSDEDHFHDENDFHDDFVDDFH